MIVIYHASCIDGFTAAWCAWHKYGDAATYLPANYGDEPPDVLGEDVLILDFSYPRRHLEYMAKVTESIRVLDHHKSAEAELAGLPFCTFDMHRSGAGIAWDELHDGPRPKLVDYVEDRDLWRWRLPQSREVSAIIGCTERSFTSWEQLANDCDVSLPMVIRHGSGVLRCIDFYVESTLEKCRWAEIGGHRVPVINTTFAVSELVGKMAESALFAVGWFQRADGKFVYSLRSRGDFDVSEIANQYGGGGHKNAAGFTTERLIHG